ALDRKSDVSEMKTGCSAAAVHPANVGGMLLLWVGLVVVLGRRNGARVRPSLARERSRKV
ncbi:MAG TPA: hypothetical protein VFU02_08030, partial [Polyangiaceae bacterium]|nr:hypothetical protein [Polyangiaceae bacterium]